MRLDLATVLAQWAAGGLAFCWVTTRHRVLGLGYGWLLRAAFAAMALGAAAAGIADPDHGTAAGVRDLACIVMALLAIAALVSSVHRRQAGVSGQAKQREQHRARVREMLGRSTAQLADAADERAALRNGAATARRPTKEFAPALDLLAPAAGVIALLAAADVAGGSYPLAAARLLVGAAFLGAVTDAMLLGHWYLVQPGLSRDPLKELVRWSAWLWPLEVALLLVPPGMTRVLDGTIDDGYGGLLGITWIVSALTTIALLGVTWLALKERFYSAVMAATGLLYLAILTAFGTDVLARALLAS